MDYMVSENKLTLLVDNVEVGYIEFNPTDCGLVINQTYIYPGLRENGYGKQLVEYMTDNYEQEIYKVKCSYFRIMSADYKLSKVA